MKNWITKGINLNTVLICLNGLLISGVSMFGSFALKKIDSMMTMVVEDHYQIQMVQHNVADIQAWIATRPHVPPTKP